LHRRFRVASINYAALRHGALVVAGGLRDAGLEPGEAVAIMLPTGFGYLRAFLGTILAGGIPVPIYPPARATQLEDHLRRHSRILDNAGAALLVSFEAARPASRLLRSLSPGVRAVLGIADLERGAPLAETVRPEPADIAFLQYTSGSTGSPKGVVLTHADLLASLRAMGAALEAGPEDVFVSWLPLYHDMGLIGAWLGSLYYGFPLVLMSPLDFLARPARWLQAIHDYRGTLSGGPNFAFELCLRRIPEADTEGLDLGSWRLAFNGAEPVNAATLRRFGARFGGCGLRPEALTPVYGLAEATLGVAFTPLGRGPRTERVARAVLARQGRAVAVTEPCSDALELVSVGVPIPGFELRIVDEFGREVGDREDGEVQFRGPSATRDYYRNPTATRALFDGNWLRSGDRGYLVAGELYLTGRSKDLIIRAGRNLYPYALEQAVGELPGVRRGCVAVFGASGGDSGTERVVVVAETRELDPDRRARLVVRIGELANDHLGVAADDVLLVPPHTVLKTSSGKIRRAPLADLYASGRLHDGPAAVWIQVVRLALLGLLRQVRMAWRRAVEIAWGGYALALTALVAFPVWGAVSFVLARSDWRWAWAHHAARLIFRGCGIPLRVVGREHLPRDGAWVLVANHASYIDGALLIAALPRPLAFVAKRELAGSAWLNRFLVRLGVRYVERFERRGRIDAVRDLTALLRDGTALGFFPEGTFRRMAGLLPFQLGAFQAAVESGVPVVPVTLLGTRTVLPDGALLPHRAALGVRIGAPVWPRAVGSDGDRWQRALRLRDQVRSEILRSCGEPDRAEPQLNSVVEESSPR